MTIRASVKVRILDGSQPSGNIAVSQFQDWLRAVQFYLDTRQLYLDQGLDVVGQSSDNGPFHAFIEVWCEMHEPEGRTVTLSMMHGAK